MFGFEVNYVQYIEFVSRRKLNGIQLCERMSNTLEKHVILGWK